MGSGMNYNYIDSEGGSGKSENFENGQNGFAQDEYEEFDQPSDGLIPK